MRQGNGTDILGPNDPRVATIGIIYVSPTDDRRSVLAAIITQEKFGRKQVAVVLPALNKAFQRLADFDGLKSMRNRLQTEVVFIAPHGSGPGEFARQRRFPVYSSLDSYAQALREEEPIEESPKRGWFGGPKPKVADAPPPTPLAPFLGDMVAGGAGVLAADQLLRPDHVAGAGSATPGAPGTEDVYQFAPDPFVPPATPLSSLPPQANVPNAPARGSRSEPESNEMTPKQDRITDEQTIYLRPDDDLTDVRERLERIPARRVTLVIPPQTLLRSLIAWRNLYARAQELGKEVLIISSDPQVRSVALGAKFRVVSSESSPPSTKPRPSGRILRPPRGGREQNSSSAAEASVPKTIPQQAVVGVKPDNSPQPGISQNTSEVVLERAGMDNLVGQQRQSPKPVSRGDDLIGQQLGSYRLTRLLVSGSLSHIYLGEHVDLGAKVAVKVFSGNIDAAAFQHGMRRIARLIHPNIVRVTDSGIKDGILFLVMDYAPKGSLHDQYSRFGDSITLPLTTIVNYVKQIAAALQEAHDHNIIQGYIHPHHMLIGDNDEILLTGFDSVFVASTEDTSISIGQHTAPERITGTILPASDQYALATIVYEWLSGQPPLALSGSVAERAARLASTPPTPLRTLVPELPQKVEDVVMKALAKDPKQRFASVEDFARALEEVSMPRSDLKLPDRGGQTFGDYRLIRLLGKGGFADVYLGKHTLMGTYAAVKVLHAQLMGEYAERFRNESRTIANLKHPQIVRVLGFGVEGETPFLVMDQAKETLRDRHPQGSVLSPKVVLPYVKQVAAALQHAHNQRLIHRDIKPENMLIGPHNEILLSDFGIATVVHQTSVKNTQSIAGTAIYMAPEQFRRRIHIASDQYSLGIVVYEWLCGQPPFTEGDFIQLGFQHNSDPPPSLHGKIPSLSPDIEKVVMIALAKDPTQRFASVQAFANALEQACK